MFADRYFAKHFYPNRYYPPGGTVIPPSPAAESHGMGRGSRAGKARKREEERLTPFEIDEFMRLNRLREAKLKPVEAKKLAAIEEPEKLTPPPKPEPIDFSQPLNELQGIKRKLTELERAALQAQIDEEETAFMLELL